MRRFLALGFIVSSLFLTGCVGWGPCGDERFVGPFRGAVNDICTTCNDHCNNCDGYNPPFGNIRRTLACGSGCGEIYYGEWVSNPPNTCNECDARGYAFGINARAPWLCNVWWPWGVKYRDPVSGYGNPLRGTHRGIHQYGGWRSGYWDRVGVVGDGCGCGTCTGGCESGCANGDCAPNAPAGQKLKPIPSKDKTSTVKKVNYVSPKVTSKYGRLKTNKSLR